MAFTHDHINAFVIVGGDSDFITLVEKLKQYDKKVFVVGGRQFTSLVMQKNCHEFIAYENLAVHAGAAAARRPRARGRASRGDRRQGAPDRETRAQGAGGPRGDAAARAAEEHAAAARLARSERDYGASTFRDFIEKVAERGVVTLRQAGRSVLGSSSPRTIWPRSSPISPRLGAAAAPSVARSAGASYARAGRARQSVVDGTKDDVAAPPKRPPAAVAAPSPQQIEDAVRLASGLFAKATTKRRAGRCTSGRRRQFLRTPTTRSTSGSSDSPASSTFCGPAQREGLLRLDRDPARRAPRVPGGELHQARDPAPPKSSPKPPTTGHNAVGDAGPAVAAGDTVVSETRFTRVTDADRPRRSSTRRPSRPRPPVRDEDLSVGPGNVAQPHESSPQAHAEGCGAPRAAEPQRGGQDRAASSRTEDGEGHERVVRRAFRPACAASLRGWPASANATAVRRPLGEGGSFRAKAEAPPSRNARRAATTESPGLV